jgi:RNA polymerase sigma-70 factor (ECF subfamily)
VNPEVEIDLKFWKARGADKRIAQEARYERLWEEFGPSLNRLVSSYEALPAAREDLLQDIRLAIWIALERFRGESSLRTFVFRIAHNRGLTHSWRRRNTESTADLREVEIEDGKANPEAVAIGNLNQDRLIDAIRTLPIQLRQAITLALEELPHREIGEILGISENNVAVRLTRARALLRQKLGEEK